MTPFFLFLWKINFIQETWKEKKGGEKAQECLEWDVKTRAGRAQGLIWDKLDSCCKGYFTALLLCCHSSHGNIWAGVSSSDVIKTHLVTTFWRLIRCGWYKRSWFKIMRDLCVWCSTNKYGGQFEEITASGSFRLRRCNFESWLNELYFCW